MTETLAPFLYFALAALAGTLALGLIRVFRGPGDGDRLVAVQLAGTTGVGLLLVLSRLMALPALVDVALILALLAAVAVAAFTAGAVPLEGRPGRRPRPAADEQEIGHG